MSHLSELRLKTGGDPRPLPDYALLRDEISKLNHPARPDVDWPRVEKYCLSLFDVNGVELQTGASYTLARMHISGLQGLNEGLAIIDALTRHQWAIFWPLAVHSRLEILNGMSLRLQKVFRTLTLQSREALPHLYQTEKHLNALRSTLLSHELQQTNQGDALIQQVQHAITRLENIPQQEQTVPDVALPSEKTLPVQQTVEMADKTRVFVVQVEPAVAEDVVAPPPEATPVPVRTWPWFLAGAFSMLLVGGLLQWGWQWLHSSDNVTHALANSVAALPQPLSKAQLREQAQSKANQQDQKVWLQQTSAQLARLSALPPGWNLQYAQQLIAQAETLWPDAPQVAQLKSRWQQQVVDNTLPAGALTGWHNGMQQLQALSDKLNALDGQRGKYITVSELKTQVFAMSNSFRQSVPVEEQLRLLAETSPGDAQNRLLRKQTDAHFNALMMKLAQESQTVE